MTRLTTQTTLPLRIGIHWRTSLSLTLTSHTRRYGSDLAPLASETFKEELYIRGYLKKPASRPTNIVARKPSAGLVFVSRKVFPKVLGRREGHKVAECLRAEQVI